MANAYDEAIQEYETRRNQTQNDINNLAVEKQNVLDAYEKNYNEQLTNYNDLMDQQQNYIDTWANTQRDTQQKQTDFNVGLINQAKQEAEKKTNAEIGNAYIDYQRGLNQFGGSAETLASQGLGGTGFAKNQDIAMNITYQNRVASAKSALQKANVDYNNQIQQALLTNDAALAEVALKQMQQSYQLALQGFEYKTTLQHNRLNYIQSINDSYFTKTNTLQSRYDSYMSAINNTKLAKQQAEEAKAAQAAALARSYRSSGGGGGGSNSITFRDDNQTGETSGIPLASSLGTAVSALVGLAGGNSGLTYKGNKLGVGYKGQSDQEIKAANQYGYKTNGMKAGSIAKGKTDSQGRSLDNAYVYEKNGQYYVYDSKLGMVRIK